MNIFKILDKIKGKKIDLGLFTLLLIIIFTLSFFLSIGNLTHDSIDYYTILQKIVSPNELGIVDNPFFLEQRAPGYSLISIPSYYFLNTISFLVNNSITPKMDSPINAIDMPEFIPTKLINAKDIFFNNNLTNQNFIYNWKIAGALILTSFILLLLGIIYSFKTLSFMKEKNKITGLFLIGIIILLTQSFTQTIIQTPTYATLCSFGIISIFTYFFIKSYYSKSSHIAILSGILLAILSLIRFEGTIIGIIIIGSLFFLKEKQLAKNILAGLITIIPLYIIYTTLMFGKIINLAFLNGDLNKILFDPNFIFQATLSPFSGAIFFSTIILIGIIGLFLTSKKPLKVLGIVSIVFIIVICFRVPVICTCGASETITIGNEIVTCATQACAQLIQSDINRYLILLVPFSLLGLQNLFFIIQEKFPKKINKK